MTTTRFPALDGRTLAVVSSIGLHLVLFAVTGGRVPHVITRDHERVVFSVVARPAAAAPSAAASTAAAAGRTKPVAARAAAPVARPSQPGREEARVDASPVAVPLAQASPSAPAGEALSASMSGPSTGTSSTVGASVSEGAVGGQGFDVAGYGRGLHARVAAKKSYPVLARRMGLEGVARLRVRLHDDGTLDGKPEVATSSGHALLDREALRMVEAAAPFPSFTGSGRRALSLLLTIRFSLDEP
jgi:protein TonB